MPKKILGREPAVFFGLCASALLALIQFLSVAPEVSGALNALVLAGAGFATASTVSAERALPALVGLVQAVFAVFLAYGSPVPESTQTGILALIAAVAAFYVRDHVLAPVEANGLRIADQIQESALAAYDNGYRAGQDDFAKGIEPLSRQSTERGVYDQDAARETGTHGHTEVMPRVGDIYESDSTTRFDDGGERNPQR